MIAERANMILSSRASPLARPGTQALRFEGWVPALQNGARALPPAGMTTIYINGLSAALEG